MRRYSAFAVLAVLLLAWQPLSAADGDLVNSATPVDQLKLLPGFQAELLYSVPTGEQGSWVSLTTDSKGRLIASDQNGALYRITPPAIGAKGETKVERLDVNMGKAHGLCYAFDSLYCVVNGAGGRGKGGAANVNVETGIYRLRDTNGDDQFDEVKLLRKLDGRGEHGPHGIVLAPDGKSLYMAAGNHTDLPEFEKSRVPRNWQEDQLLPRMVDARGHAADRRAPGGWVCRFGPDGEALELISVGYRNEYDLAFNPAGELFTYDSDMEWDVGTPWYRPTRVVHVTSGSEFGWRTGTGKFPTYYADTLPPVLNIGPGSPTGVVFGTGAKFPAKYQQALFICDWSYGTLYAVHLTPEGATYAAEREQFITAAPLPLTDLVIHPQDGAMYFTIGGRGTQSGLYRITYTGDESTAPAKHQADAGEQLRALRHKLESLHKPLEGEAAKDAVKTAWPYLSHDDRHIRFAARIAVEQQPVAVWGGKALTESNPHAAILAAIALARCGDEKSKSALLMSLGRFEFASLGVQEQLALLRAYGLVIARYGRPSAKEREVILKQLDASYPAKNRFLNRELCSLLATLKADDVVPRTLALLSAAPTQEEQIHYALALRALDSGWTLDQRRAYFEWFTAAAGHRGGASFGGFLNNIRQEAIERLSEKEKLALKATLDAKPKAVDPEAELKARPFVKKWEIDPLVAAVEGDSSQRDMTRGRQLFAAANCFKCHRFAGEGGASGPDLTTVGRRFNTRNLLESIVDPSKVISDQYQSNIFILDDGRTISGRVVNLSGGDLRVMTNMLDPGNLTAVKRASVEEMLDSPTSMMPTGLLDTFSEDEILDLLAYLRAGGDVTASANSE
ncbi:MAG: c-type cytochrome [Pirellulaceae bacterium]